MTDGTLSNSSYWLSPQRFVIILTGFLILVCGVGYGLAAWTALPFQEIMSVFSVLASIALSATLAYLYLRMSKIQSDQRDISKRQSDLMSSQHELMEAEHTPVLSLGRLYIQSTESDWMVDSIEDSELDIDVEGVDEISWEKLMIPLNNLGRGIATELKIDVRVTPIEDGDETNGGFVSFHRAIEPDNHERYGYISVDSKELPLSGHWHNFLEPGSTTFEAKMLFRMEFDEEEFVDLSFSGLIKYLREQGEERARVDARITYKDIVGNADEIRIFTYNFNVDEVDTLSEVISSNERAGPDPDFRRNVVS